MLSRKNQCLVCDCHQYTQIFYERGILACNRELAEVRDPEVLDELRFQYENSGNANKTLTPLICGTLINHKPGQAVFERKLKMLRTSLYSLLSVVQCYKFAENDEQVDEVKDAVLAFLTNDSDEVFKQNHIKECLDGWK